MSHKKLQKLCYYAYSWVLSLMNDSADNIEFKLFNEEIQAWVHGPVCVDLYHAMKGYGWLDIPKYDGEVSSFPSEILEKLEKVWGVYGSYNSSELEDMTHQERPWKEARAGIPEFQPSNNRISDKIIFEYYNKLYQGS